MDSVWRLPTSPVPRAVYVQCLFIAWSFCQLFVIECAAHGSSILLLFLSAKVRVWLIESEKSFLFIPVFALCCNCCGSLNRNNYNEKTQDETNLLTERRRKQGSRWHQSPQNNFDLGSITWWAHNVNISSPWRHVIVIVTRSPSKWKILFYPPCKVVSYLPS